MKTTVTLFCLISTVSALTSSLHQLSWYSNTTVPIPIDVSDGSNIYLTSSDKAVALSKITLSTKGQSITLDKLLSKVNDDGSQIGWSVSSDLTISTTNTLNVSKALLGSIYISTPTMAHDPNFLVYVVRGTKPLDRTDKANTTVVFLSVQRKNAELPTYAGFDHTRIEEIVQPKTGQLYFYRGDPDDNYGDINNGDNLNKRIFANPLNVYQTGDVASTLVFFDNIDPIQYSLQVWHMRAIGGVKMTVSDTYVDTTNIVCTKVTTTGMSNSQLFAYNSSVTFASIPNNMGQTGYITTTEMYWGNNLTYTLNGNGQSWSATESNSIYNHMHAVSWAADSLKLYPSNLVTGIYFVQYFKVDGGAPTTTTMATMPISSSAAGSSSGAPSSAPSSTSAATPPAASSASTVSPPSTTQTVQTTTKSVTSSLATFSLSMSSLYLFFHV